MPLNNPEHRTESATVDEAEALLAEIRGNTRARRLARYHSAPFDHGFQQAGGERFDDLDDALRHAARQPQRTERSPHGTVWARIAWYVRDTETGEVHAPRPEHYEVAP